MSIKHKRRRNPGLDESSSHLEYLSYVIKELKEKLVPYHFAYLNAYVSTLGGIHRPTIMITVSFEPKSMWKNGILENSRYAKISVDHTGKMEMFSGSIRPALRKKTIKNALEIEKTLYLWSQKVMGSSIE